jgi:hypothetical protein
MPPNAACGQRPIRQAKPPHLQASSKVDVKPCLRGNHGPHQMPEPVSPRSPATPAPVTTPLINPCLHSQDCHKCRVIAMATTVAPLNSVAHVRWGLWAVGCDGLGGTSAPAVSVLSQIVTAVMAAVSLGSGLLLDASACLPALVRCCSASASGTQLMAEAGWPRRGWWRSLQANSGVWRSVPWHACVGGSVVVGR